MSESRDAGIQWLEDMAESQDDDDLTPPVERFDKP